MIRRPPRATLDRAAAASDVYKRQIENANRVATQVADRILSDTAVVKTGNPLQPFRVVLASNAPQGRTVSRVVTCNDDEP